MTPPIRAAIAYFAIAFGFGMVFGTIRVLLLAPKLGELAAVLFEVPIMLVISALGSRWAVRRFGVGDALADRLAVGLVAFGLLLVAETLLAGLVGTGTFGNNVPQNLQEYGSPPRLVGLAAQVVFALIPLFVPRRSADV
ncbi:hypothetical protein [Chthonobacter albigriseus]|uniref:hypothetical protein n=1 Tax=Chthonobacter albigriseus TaxID=1683161 RepID=UPI0015EF03DE|nr:hypothetical protein [Chthonobacter albigriseus]